MSILGREPSTYDHYAEAIFREVGLPEEEFAPLRQAFLKSMLARERIFHTDRFQQQYEANARSNMQHELEGRVRKTAQ